MRRYSLLKTQDIKPNKLKVLIYGESGSGKTQFAGTFPKPYFIDTDDGMLTLRGKDGIEYDTYIDESPNRPIACSIIEKKIGELQKNCPYETIVLDGITTVSDLAMNRILSLNGRPGGVPQQQDWLQQMNWIKNHIAILKALPVHLVVAAHMNIEKDENLGMLKALPAVTGKLAGKIGGLFDEVYNTQVLIKGKDSEYRLLTKTYSIYQAKSRLGCFEMYEVPDFKTMISKVK